VSPLFILLGLQYNYLVILFGGQNNTNFKGFMIQGRVVADDSPVGTFIASEPIYQLQCTNVRQF